MPGLASWQCIPSKLVPEPVHGPALSHCFCVGSLMHLPLTGHALSLVHQQHWKEVPQRLFFDRLFQPLVGPPSHVVPVGHLLMLQVGPTTEQPALSAKLPPEQRAPEHLPLLHPPLSRPLLLH
jgi:hypothetical protein